MRVVVTGGGAVGRHLAQDLTERGHDVTPVEQRRDLAEKLSHWAPDTRVVYGDACEPRIPERSPNDGKPLYELRLPPDTTLVAILREGHVMIPQPETTLAAGDEIVALSSADSEPALRDSVMGTAGPDAKAPAAETA